MEWMTDLQQEFLDRQPNSKKLLVETTLNSLANKWEAWRHGSPNEISSSSLPSIQEREIINIEERKEKPKIVNVQVPSQQTHKIYNMLNEGRKKFTAGITKEDFVQKSSKEEAKYVFIQSRKDSENSGLVLNGRTGLLVTEDNWKQQKSPRKSNIFAFKEVNMNGDYLENWTFN